MFSESSYFRMTDFVKKKIIEKLVVYKGYVIMWMQMSCVHRFTKDLKPSDISLGFLTGRGVLTNLELNCDFITEVLQLPPWIRVARFFEDPHILTIGTRLSAYYHGKADFPNAWERCWPTCAIPIYKGAIAPL